MNSFIEQDVVLKCAKSKKMMIFNELKDAIFNALLPFRRLPGLIFYVFCAHQRKANYGAKHSCLSCTQSGPPGFEYDSAQIWSHESNFDSFLKFQ